MSMSICFILHFVFVYTVMYNTISAWIFPHSPRLRNDCVCVAFSSSQSTLYMLEGKKVLHFSEQSFTKGQVGITVQYKIDVETGNSSAWVKHAWISKYSVFTFSLIIMPGCVKGAASPV